MNSLLPSDMNYAKAYKRALAMIIDFGLFFLVFTPVTYLVKGVWIMSSLDHLWIILDPICLVFLGIIILYFITLDWLFGQSFGKWIMHIKIVPESGAGKLTLKQSAIRLATLLIDGFLVGTVGLIIMSKSDKKQRLGDKITGAIVIDTRKSRKQ